MIGLLQKDISIIRKQLAIFLIVLVFYGIWAATEGNAMMFAYMVILFGFFIPITAIGYDERAQWNKYAICMPIKKSDIITSKYLLGFLAILMGTIGYLVLSFFIGSTPFSEVLKNCFVMISIGMTFLSLYLPACFKFGSERARYFLIAICMLPSLIIFGLSKANISIPKPSDVSLKLLINFAPLLAFIITVASCALSIHVINHKEY